MPSRKWVIFSHLNELVRALERYAEILDHCAFLRRGTMRRAYRGAPELMLQGQHLEGGSTPLTTALGEQHESKDARE